MKHTTLLSCVSAGSLLVAAAAFAQETAAPSESYWADSSMVPPCGPFRISTALPEHTTWPIALPSPFAVTNESELAGGWLGGERYRIEGDHNGAAAISWLHRPGDQAAEACGLGCCASDDSEDERCEVFQFFAKAAFDTMSKADHLTVAAKHLEAAGLVDEAAKLRNQMGIGAQFGPADAKYSEASAADSDLAAEAADSDASDSDETEN